MHRKDDFTYHMTLGEALVRLTGLGERIAFGDWNPELRSLHRRVEALEFANAGNAVVTDQCHAAPLLRRWLDAVRVRNTAAGSKRVQTSLHRVSAADTKPPAAPATPQPPRLILHTLP